MRGYPRKNHYERAFAIQQAMKMCIAISLFTSHYKIQIYGIREV